MVNQELIEYIKNAKQTVDDPARIKQDLLRKGWLEGDIDQAFVLAGVETSSDAITNSLTTDEMRRKGRYAVVAIALAVLAVLVMVFFLNALLAMFLALGGFVTGLLGMKSSKKVLAIIGWIVSLLVLIVSVYAIYLGAYVLATGNDPITKEPLTDEQLMRDWGLTREDIL